MSWQAVAWVLEFSLSEGYSRLVLISIASHANREGKSAFPSLDTIARETLMCKREVVYCIQALEEMGELRIERGIGRGNPNHYEIPKVTDWLEKVHNTHHLDSGKGAPEKIKGAPKRVKGALKARDCPIEENKELPQDKRCTSGVQPLKVKDRTVKSSEALRSLCSIPERSKPLSRADIEMQKEELRRRGFLN